MKYPVMAAALLAIQKYILALTEKIKSPALIAGKHLARNKAAPNGCKWCHTTLQRSIT